MISNADYLYSFCDGRVNDCLRSICRICDIVRPHSFAELMDVKICFVEQCSLIHILFF